MEDLFYESFRYACGSLEGNTWKHHTSTGVVEVSIEAAGMEAAMEDSMETSVEASKGASTKSPSAEDDGSSDGSCLCESNKKFYGNNGRFQRNLPR